MDNKARTSHNDEMTNYLCKSISTSKVDVGNYRFPLTISDSFRDKSNNLARPDFRYINAWRSVEDSPMRTILNDSRQKIAKLEANLINWTDWEKEM